MVLLKRPRPLSLCFANPAPPKWEPLAVHANFIFLPRPLPLGEVAPKVTERARMSAWKELLSDNFPLTKADDHRCKAALESRACPLRRSRARSPKGRAFQRHSSQIAVAPQGTTPPVAETGRPISSQLVFPPKRGISVVLSIYSMTAGERPVV